MSLFVAINNNNKIIDRFIVAQTSGEMLGKKRVIQISLTAIVFAISDSEKEIEES